MRIANKLSPPGHDSSLLLRFLLIAGVFFLGLGIISLAPAYANDALPTPVVPPTATAGSTPNVAPSPPPAAPTAANAASQDIGKTISAMEEKATDSAKSALKNLDGTDPMTLEELNHIHQITARIDAMIDVEKHLSELEKAREAKNGGGASSSFANAIPASALAPLPSKAGNAAVAITAPPSVPVASPPVIMHAVSVKPDISRIVGSDGKYEAVLKMTDGDIRTVRVGDPVNGGTVRWITSSALGLEEKGQTTILHVKNIDVVTSAVR